MTYQHRRIVHNLLLRGCLACVVCKNSIDETDDLRIVLIDSTCARRMDNMRLRHALCQHSKYQPTPIGSTELLIDLMITSPLKLCSVCKKSWVGSELEDLTVGGVGSVKGVLHRVCL